MENKAGKSKDDKNRGKRQVVTEIASLTAGLAGTTLDLVVLIAALGGSLILFGPRGKDLYADRKYKNAYRVAEWIFNKFQKTRFRQALDRAASQGYLVRIARGEYQLTVRGKKHLRQLLPEYKLPSKWDGQLWLVTYDIPENQRKSRDILRDRLDQIGCGLIQKSVWLSVKDPRKWLKDFVQENNLSGLVIVSHLGRDGNIGEEGVTALTSRVFKIAALEKRYQKWLSDIQKPNANFQPAAFSYLSILRSDPVLPNELLPQPWIGDKARQIFESKILQKSGDIYTYLS